MTEIKDSDENQSKSSKSFFIPYLDLFLEELSTINQPLKFKVVGYITNLSVSELQIDDGTSTLTVFFGRRFEPEGLVLGGLVRLFVTLSISDSGEKRFYADFYQNFTGVDITTYQQLIKAERHIDWKALHQ